jgi:hypothetical protein
MLLALLWCLWSPHHQVAVLLLLPLLLLLLLLLLLRSLCCRRPREPPAPGRPSASRSATGRLQTSPSLTAWAPLAACCQRPLPLLLLLLLPLRCPRWRG